MTRPLTTALRIAMLSVLVLAGLGCDSNGGDDDKNPSLSGQWLGTTTVEGATLTVDVQLLESNGIVNGNGTMVYVNPVPIGAQGTYNFPNLSMTITSDFDDLNFTGTLSADGNALTGSMRGSGFDNFSITLRRQ